MHTNQRWECMERVASRQTMVLCGEPMERADNLPDRRRC